MANLCLRVSSYADLVHTVHGVKIYFGSIPHKLDLLRVCLAFIRYIPVLLFIFSVGHDYIYSLVQHPVYIRKRRIRLRPVDLV